jgi:hypothetical protein
MKVAWERLIRFIAEDGRVLRGEPILPSPEFDLGSTTAETGLRAKVISGQDIYDTTGVTVVTDEVVTVKTLLGPLAQEDVPILRCVGLNYAKHSKRLIHPPSLSANPGSYLEDITETFVRICYNTSCVSLTDVFSPAVKEAGRSPPPFPFIFFKPVTTIVGQDENVVIPKIAQDDQADYEGELVCRPYLMWDFDPLHCFAKVFD